MAGGNDSDGSGPYALHGQSTAASVPAGEVRAGQELHLDEEGPEGGQRGRGDGNATLDDTPYCQVGKVVEVVWVAEQLFGIRDASNGRN